MEQERYLFSRSHIQLRGSIKLWGPKSSLWQPNDFPSSLIYVYAPPVNVMELHGEALPVINRISDFPFKGLVPWISGNSADASVGELPIVIDGTKAFHEPHLAADPLKHTPSDIINPSEETDRWKQLYLLLLSAWANESFLTHSLGTWKSAWTPG